jgi:hypothetical protein
MAEPFSPSSTQAEQDTGLVAALERIHKCRGPYDNVRKGFSLPAAVNMYLGHPVVTVQPGGCTGIHSSTSNSRCAGCADVCTIATINQAFADEKLECALKPTTKTMGQVWRCRLACGFLQPPRLT